MTASVLEGLARCQSLDQFRDLCAPLGVFTDRRFMHLELDLVNRCNIRCVMCYHSLESTRRTSTVYLSPDDFAAIASRVLPHAHRLSLSLGNEPLMSPHFITILGIAARYAVPNINFFTNGLLLNDANIDAIIHSGVTQVCVSVDGATPATYNYIRRDGDFYQLLRRVEQLVARRDAAGSPTPRLRFDIVMMQRNIHELVDLVKLAARVGVDQLCFRHIVSFEGLGMEQESLTHTKALSNYWLDLALRAADDLGLDVQQHPAPFDLGDEKPDPAAATDGAAFLPRPYCPFPFFHVSMGPGGQVHACPHAHGEAPYGQVSVETPIDQIWLNSKFMTLRRRILRRDPPDMCRRCPFLALRHPDIASLHATRRH